MMEVMRNIAAMLSVISLSGCLLIPIDDGPQSDRQDHDEQPCPDRPPPEPPVQNCVAPTNAIHCDTVDAYVTSAADVTAVSQCDSLKSLYVDKSSTVTSIALPNLRTIGSVYLDGIAIQQFTATCLTHAASVASFYTDNLTTVELPRLQSVAGDFQFGYVSGLSHLAIAQLARVGGFFYIADTRVLSKLEAGKLSTVGGYLYVNNNPSMSHMNLRGLTSIGGYAYIAKNPLACAPSAATLEPITQSYVYEMGNGSCP
jgi:hypothetical protein